MNYKDTFSVFRGSQGKLNILLVLLWGAYLFKSLSNFILSRVPVIKDYKEFLFPAIVIVFLVFNLHYLTKSRFFTSVIFYIITALVIIFSWGNAPMANAEYIEEYLPAFFFTVLPFVFVGAAYNDERLFNVIYLVSVLSILFFLFYNYVLHPASELLFDEKVRESQGLAYRVLPFLIVVVWKTMDDFTIVRLFISVFTFISLIVLGCRGAMFAVFVFIILYLAFVKRIIRKVWSFSLLVVAAFLGYVYINSIALFLLEIAGDLGYSTRIFELFLEGEINSDNARNMIAEKTINALTVNPMGLGLCGAQALTSFYAHNLFLELAATYGWLIGCAINILLIYLLFRGYVCCANDAQKGFYFVLFCTSFVPLMVSGIFLKEPLLFMLIGYCFCLIYNKKRT